MSKRNLLLIAAVIALTIGLAACASTSGSTGPAGPAGPAGPEGPQGPAGAQNSTGSVNPVSPTTTKYVGGQICAGCHPDIYKNYIKSGHPWSLNRIVDGEPPSYPFTKIGQIPKGYTWNDIRYVIGGYNWKALFTDNAGYIITDAPGNTGDNKFLNQWNFANELVGKNASMVGYHSGQEKLLNTCGECHTTGYTSVGNQDGLPGLVGTWAEDGVQCEACHGPGSLHSTDPQNIDMKINRTSDLCAECHSNADLETVDSVAPNSMPHPPAETIYRGKHMVLDCVDCHDPHSGVVQSRIESLPTTRASCEECHYKEANYQNNAIHERINLACMECHLPRMVKTAWGDSARFIGDIHSHQVAITTTRSDQLVTTGEEQTYVIAPTGLNYACRQCHGSGRATAKTDEELQVVAEGYHNQP